MSRDLRQSRTAPPMEEWVKKLTGETPHSYIVKSRLDLCRHYIEQGKSIREVYALGGFGGYNHFFRAFKKEYGVTPMQYYNNLQIDRNEK